ncbi:DUF2062 domain-containing protein [Natrarchaeobius chitinivorans]|uniref:DUF2062 domain-containing protein n=1 Tax=Natrarchaeobius chitinivorans TaxID=1679083 RepID=A0A3N6MRL8_NATCH|nr:DUF2062 domain-containing protein [Natrarchaeobius chitinivorans]RQG97316.1 DUF2062 domain-containing protein [Natrarchaeobius chitinivorans]
MLRERLASYRDRVRRELTEAFQAEHTPHQVASSFSIGIFVTALPTGGLGIGLFFVFVSLWSWISKPAIFASVAVLNPFVKPAVYVASLQVGATALGTDPIPLEETATASAWAVFQQLAIGNLLIAILLSLVSYGLVFHLTRAHRRRNRGRPTRSLVTTLMGLKR